MVATGKNDADEPRVLLGEVRGGKPVVRWFVSYAHADRARATQLRERLALQLGNSKQYCFEPWHDGELVVGEDWHGQIRQHLASAHLGVLFLSHAFLASTYIGKEELPQFVRGGGQAVEGKRVVPVALEVLDLATTDLKGLEARQVFRDDMGLAFSERQGAKRDRWVMQLVQQFHTLLQRYADVAVGSRG